MKDTSCSKIPLSWKILTLQGQVQRICRCNRGIFWVAACRDCTTSWPSKTTSRSVLHTYACSLQRTKHNHQASRHLWCLCQVSNRCVSKWSSTGRPNCSSSTHWRSDQILFLPSCCTCHSRCQQDVQSYRARTIWQGPTLICLENWSQQTTDGLQNDKSRLWCLRILLHREHVHQAECCRLSPWVPSGCKGCRRLLLRGWLPHRSWRRSQCYRATKAVTRALSKGGFLLRKWRSSEPSILRDLPNDLKDPHSMLISLDADNYTKTLGIAWNATSDHFRITVAQLPPLEKLTKRALVSDIAKTFDVLGWFHTFHTSQLSRFRRDRPDNGCCVPLSHFFLLSSRYCRPIASCACRRA